MGDSLAAVKKLGETVNGGFSEIFDRIEALEALKDRPAANSGQYARADYKTFATERGNVYEVPSHARLADVPALRAQKQPEISLERWLAATVAGERCGDREALEFCRERKQMV
ncbi:MAG TPA: hypothetical protein VJT80_13515, partial [Steroidobacteraceae bacterium]|nr:hypothetical protein [Steroidobacteraceae bacterium]